MASFAYTPARRSKTQRRFRVQEIRDGLALYRRGIDDRANGVQLHRLGLIAKQLAGLVASETNAGGRDPEMQAAIQAIYSAGDVVMKAAH